MPAKTFLRRERQELLLGQIAVCWIGALLLLGTLDVHKVPGLLVDGEYNLGGRNRKVTRSLFRAPSQIDEPIDSADEKATADNVSKRHWDEAAEESRPGQ